MSDESKPTVLLTGFGPFRNYAVNASWSAVSLVQMDKVNLVKREIAVAYEEVDREVPRLWAQFKPTLTVHCGVSSQCKCLVLETRACRWGYQSPDVKGCTPKGGPEEEDGEDRDQSSRYLRTALDIPRICETVNGFYDKGAIRVPVVVSQDAGRYLCEYTYFASLREDQDQQRTLFIHCPELEVFTAKETSEAIKCVIRVALEELKKKKGTAK